MLQSFPGQVGAGWRTHLPSLRAGGRAEKGRGPRHGMCPVNASPTSAAPAFSGGLKRLQCARVCPRRAIQRALSRMHCSVLIAVHSPQIKPAPLRPSRRLGGSSRLSSCRTGTGRLSSCQCHRLSSCCRLCSSSTAGCLTILVVCTSDIV